MLPRSVGLCGGQRTTCSGLILYGAGGLDSLSGPAATGTSLTKLFDQPQKILFMVICYINIFPWVLFILVKTCLKHIAKAVCSDHVFSEEVLLLLIYLHWCTLSHCLWRYGEEIVGSMGSAFCSCFQCL